METFGSSIEADVSKLYTDSKQVLPMQVNLDNADYIKINMPKYLSCVHQFATQQLLVPPFIKNVHFSNLNKYNFSHTIRYDNHY